MINEYIEEMLEGAKTTNPEGYEFIRSELDACTTIAEAEELAWYLLATL